MSMARKMVSDGSRGSETKAFGEVLQRLRAEKGLTQDSLAVFVGTERSHISALERAEKAPSFATLLRLAAALDMSAAQLVDLVEKQLAARAPDPVSAEQTLRGLRPPRLAKRKR
jgi:transcriptional regulator with XRE-family HTH domain